ncbi:MAG: hypothetical protein OXH61_08985 [Acidimicrobiaceae bacterium]|nr:hypothetical protein [Acidimicrobiaceae bacterium]
MARATLLSGRFRGVIRGARWFGFVLLVFVLGCQGGDSKVRVLDAPVDGAETVQPGPGTGDDSGGSEPPVGPGDGPGGPDDGSTGPVGDTGGGDGDGAGIAPGVGDQPGGLRLMAPRPPYEGLADEIFDMCNDADAFAVVFARSLGPGEEMTDEERDAVTFDRVVNQVSCDEPGGRRYVHMSDFGPSGAFATAQAATEDHNDRNRNAAARRIIHPPDIPLGYFGHLDWSFPLEDVDEIRVVADSVLVRDGVVRGLVRNFSKTLFGREVTVTVSAVEGKEGVNNNAQPVSGRFPLTVQPGERAPFEILRWTGSADPADFVLVVTADLSTRVDITRSFGWGRGGSILTNLWNEEEFKNFVPDFVYQTEKHKIPDNDRFLIEHVEWDQIAPTSHPGLKDQVLNQTIEDVRLYMALIGNGKIYDIIEPPLYRPLSRVNSRYYPQVVRQPTIINGYPQHGFAVTFIPEYSWHMWVGEPGPLDYNPRPQPGTGPEIEPEPPTTSYPTQQPSSPTTSAPADDF